MLWAAVRCTVHVPTDDVKKWKRTRLSSLCTTCVIQHANRMLRVVTLFCMSFISISVELVYFIGWQNVIYFGWKYYTADKLILDFNCPEITNSCYHMAYIFPSAWQRARPIRIFYRARTQHSKAQFSTLKSCQATTVRKDVSEWERTFN